MNCQILGTRNVRRKLVGLLVILWEIIQFSHLYYNSAGIH